MPFQDLSHELLLLITDYLKDDTTRSGDQANGTIPSDFVSLSLVSRNLNQIAESYIYKRVRIDIPHAKDQPSISSQRPIPPIHALEKKPYRYEFIEVLEINSHVQGQNYGEMLPSLLKLLKRTSNVKTCNFIGNDSLILNSALFQALNSKSIRRLVVGVANIEQMTQPRCLRDLEYLKFSGIQLGAGLTHSDWWETYELPVERRGISPVQHLKISWKIFGYYNDHPCAVIPILSWIAALRVLEIDFIDPKHLYQPICDTSQLQRILDVHSGTLERVTYTAYYGRTIPNFQHFAKLEHLSMSVIGLFETDAEYAVSKLAAPHLQSLTINMSWQQGGRMESLQFGNLECYWFKRFVEAYRLLVPEGGIANIHLDMVDRIYKNGNKALRTTRVILKQNRIDFKWESSHHRESTTLDRSDR